MYLQSRCLYEEVLCMARISVGTNAQRDIANKDSLATLCYEMRDLPAARKLREVRALSYARWNVQCTTIEDQLDGI